MNFFLYLFCLYDEVPPDSGPPVQGVEESGLVQYAEEVGQSHGKSVHGEGRPPFVLLFEQIFRRDGVLHEVKRQRWNYYVEVTQMDIGVTGHESVAENLDEYLEVVRVFAECLLEAVNDGVQIVRGLHGSGWDGLGYVAKFREWSDGRQVRQEPDSVAGAPQAAWPNQPDVTHGISYLGDQASELVQVRQPLRCEAELPDAEVELLGSLERKPFLLRSPHRPPMLAVFDQPRLDLLIVKKLRKNLEFCDQELVGEIDGGVDDARPVGSDGICNVGDVQRVQKLAWTFGFNKNLLAQTVMVRPNENR